MKINSLITMEAKHKSFLRKVLANSFFLILADATISIVTAFCLEAYVLAFPLVLTRMMALLALFPVSFWGFNMLFSSRVAPYLCTFILVYLSIAVIGSLVSLEEKRISEVFVGLHSRFEFYTISYLPFVISFCVTYLLDLTLLDK